MMKLINITKITVAKIADLELSDNDINKVKKFSKEN